MARNMTQRPKSIAAVAALLLSAISLSACGAAKEADEANGKELFVTNCGSCHAMTDAGTKGTIGPDLDDAFQSRHEGFKASTFQGVVRYWIANPDPLNEPAMPKDILTGQDAEDVAKYVALNAAKVKDGETYESPIRPAEPIEPIRDDVFKKTGN